MTTYINRHAKEQGLRIVEARKPLKIEVTKGDIKSAKVKNSKCCAFACAAKRQYKARAAYFLLSKAYIEYDDRLVRYTLPQSVQKEIVSFDRAHTMAPGVYMLSPVGKASSLAAGRKRRDDKRTGRHMPNPASGKRKIIHKTQNVRSAQEPA